MQPTTLNSETTVGILYCGDMGSAFGKLLREGGLRVVTTCEGRSRTTQQQAVASGIEILPKLEDVVAQSHFVFSLVLPSAAVEVARNYAACCRVRPQESVFIEANAINMETMEEIDRLMAERNIPLVDAAIQGVKRLQNLGVLYLSGPKARRVEAVCQGLVLVNCVGTRIGLASQMKLLMLALSNGLAALALETGMLAERAGMLEPFLKSCQQLYSGVMTVVERTLPTYPRHAARRAVDVREIEEMAHSLGLRAGMTHEAGELIQFVASLQWDKMKLEDPSDIRTIIHSVANARPPEKK
ncbi:MAG: NAD(P)-dependent oxidoreductase [Acidobacteria bacterium]|nr:MAG: NAD(P)-dependent oxidoreductase [Acidobacteriota bacterium]